MRRFALPSISSMVQPGGHGALPDARSSAAEPLPRPMFSAETLASASVEARQALDEVLGSAKAPSVVAAETAATETAVTFEKQLQQWQEVMLLVREQQKVATELRKRRRGVESALLASMEALDRLVHKVSADKALMVVENTQFQPITAQYLTDQLPKVVQDPALALEIQHFLLSQRAQKTRKTLKVGRPKSG